MRLLHPRQTDLSVGAPDDAYEKEADRVAQAAEDTPGAELTAGGLAPDKKSVRRQPEGGASGRGPAGGRPLRRYLAASQGEGRPLASAIRGVMERRLGHQSLDAVRIHTGAEAASAARALQARAFTVGQDVYFGQGEYQPHSRAGRRLLAHELVHTRQPGRAIRRQTVEQQTAMDSAIETARAQYPDLGRDLNEVTLRIYVLGDRSVIHVEGESQPLVYPTRVAQAQSGYYLAKWDGEGNWVTLWNLSTGTQITTDEEAPFVAMQAGEEEFRRQRAQRVGIFWISHTVTEPPPPEQPSAADLQFPLTPADEVPRDEFELGLDALKPPRSLVIPGATGGAFHPDYRRNDEGRAGYYPRPFNFTYYTTDGTHVYLSRRLVGQDFFYIVPVRALQDFMRFYPIEYAGRSALGMAVLGQVVVDVSVSFMPVVGPLYGLIMSARNVYEAYHNWDKMSGWEKALVGLDVMFSVVPAIRGAKKVVKGTLAFDRGVDTLVKAGVTRAEAQRLMAAAAIFQSDHAALAVVDELTGLLRQGERLTVQELAEVERIFQLMLDQIPEVERGLVAAGYATRNLDTARRFLHDIPLSEAHLTGLRRLMPEVMLAFQTVAKAQPELVQRVASWAERSADVARGINKLEGVTRYHKHLLAIIDSAGEDVLEALGRSPVTIGDELAAYVRNAPNPTVAYERLMRGSLVGQPRIVGLAELLAQARPTALTPALQTVESRFRHAFLTAEQLGGLGRLTPPVLDALAQASEGQLRAVATMAARSAHGASGVEYVAQQLLGAGLAPYNVADVIYQAGGGLIELVGRLSIPISPDLARAVATRGGSVEILMMGRGGAYRLTGVLDEIAARLKGSNQMEAAVAGITSGYFRSHLFARWAALHPKAIVGVTAVQNVRPQDATEMLAKISDAFGNDIRVARGFLTAFGTIYARSGSKARLERIIAEVGAGSSKAMGASLTLTYALRRLGGKVKSFELSVTRSGVTRVYDMVAKGVQYEFKYWTSFALDLEHVVKARDEFRRDLILHAANGFKDLRWVISNDVQGYEQAIKDMMLDMLNRPDVRHELEQVQGLVIDDVKARLRHELDHGLLEFFDSGT